MSSTGVANAASGAGVTLLRQTVAEVVEMFRKAHLPTGRTAESTAPTPGVPPGNGHEGNILAGKFI